MQVAGFTTATVTVTSMATTATGGAPELERIDELVKSLGKQLVDFCHHT